MQSDNAKTQGRQDSRARSDLDQAVEGTFPASDPIAVHAQEEQERLSPDQAPHITREVYEKQQNDKQQKERRNG